MQNSSAYDPSYLLLEESRKSWQYVIGDKLVHPSKTLKVYFDSFYGIAKDYIEGRVWIESHVTFQCQGCANHYIVIVEFQKMRKPIGNVRKPHMRDVAVHWNSPVLVNVAEFVKSPKKVAVNGIHLPCLIRLKHFNDAACICGHTSCATPDKASVGNIENGKFRSLGMAFTEAGQSPDDMVKRSPQATQEISNDKRKTFGYVGNGKVDTVPLCFQVTLGPKSVRLRILEGVQLIPERIEMFARPFCLKIGVG